tara:strand:- start:6832 stop:7659 length:828 start_codon:yes stop_codon:yes gene_type:complete
MSLIDRGRQTVVDGITTNYHDHGKGDPVVLLHGSGPGVSAWQNWGEVIPSLSDRFRVIAPDIVGFGLSPLPEGSKPGIKLWLNHLVGLLDALELKKVALIGNSFGGALSLAMMSQFAHRVSRIVLMGTPVGEFEQTPGLGSTHGFSLTKQNMEKLMKQFPFDPKLVTPAMVDARFAMADVNSGLETIRALQPKPSEDGAPVMVRGVPLSQLEKIKIPVLIVHGREDKLVPLELAINAHKHIEDSELHVFSRCGHWVQLERKPEFVGQVMAFLGRE